MYRIVLTIIALGMSVLLIACSPTSNDNESVEMQDTTILIFNPLAPLLEEYVEGLQTELSEQGLESITYLTVEAPESYSPPALSSAFVPAIADENIDIVLCITTLACIIAKDNLPEDVTLIFTGVTDPISTGLVEDFATDNGNITGVASAARNASNEGRAFAWLMEVNPEIDTIFIPHNPNDSAANIRLATTQSAADDLDVELVIYEVNNEEDLATVVENMPGDVDAVITFSESILTVPFMLGLSDETVSRGIPHMSFSLQFGQTLTYSPDNTAIGRQAGILASRIISGTSASDLPVEVPEFDLYISLPVAEATGITLSDQILRQAIVIREEE